MIETGIIKQVQLLASKMGARLFRNNTGVGWVGKSTRIKKDIFIKDARPLHAGLCTGSSDLIGWTEREITPDMVGKRVAVFTAVEVKSGRLKATEAQVKFLEQVRRSGGIARLVRSADELQDGIF